MRRNLLTSCLFAFSLSLASCSPLEIALNTSNYQESFTIMFTTARPRGVLTFSISFITKDLNAKYTTVSPIVLRGEFDIYAGKQNAYTKEYYDIQHATYPVTYTFSGTFTRVQTVYTDNTHLWKEFFEYTYNADLIISGDMGYNVDVQSISGTIRKV